MSFDIDMTTAFLSLVAGHLFTIVLIMAYRIGQKKDRTFAFFYSAKWLQVVGWGLSMFREDLPVIITIAVANITLLLGAACEAVALLKAVEVFNKKIRRLYFLMTGFSVLAFVGVMMAANSELDRIAIASVSMSLLLILPGLTLLKVKKGSLLMRVIGMVYFSIALGAMARGVMAWTTIKPLTLFQPSVYQMISFMALYLIMFIGNTGFVLLSKEKADQELQMLAHYDDLTGIWNRRRFTSEAERVIHSCYTQQLPVSFLLMDVDEYKSINDTYGHDIGDTVLREYSRNVKLALSDKDLVARFGGDEFAVLLPGVDVDHSERIAEYIRSSMEQSAMKLSVPFTLSIGIVTSTSQDKLLLDDLYKLSDTALYKAKRLGRNQVARIEP